MGWRAVVAAGVVVGMVLMTAGVLLVMLADEIDRWWDE